MSKVHMKNGRRGVLIVGNDNCCTVRFNYRIREPVTGFKLARQTQRR